MVSRISEKIKIIQSQILLITQKGCGFAAEQLSRRTGEKSKLCSRASPSSTVALKMQLPSKPTKTGAKNKE